MSGIHYAILDHLKTTLTADLITKVLEDDEDDNAVPGAIKIGPLQGDPDPDEARISVEIYLNDPDTFVGGAVTSLGKTWADEVEMIEAGNAITMKRRFTIKTRCLLEKTREDLAGAHDINSKLLSRIQASLLNTSFTGVAADDGEYVARGIFSESLTTEVLQAGGPPDNYDFVGKIRFDVLTTKTGAQL